MIDWKNYPNFSDQEFRCQHTGKRGISEKLVRRLQLVRNEYGKPMVVTSGYRDPKHPIERVKKVPGAHSSGLAADIRVGPGEDVHRLVELAMKHGFTGIGISQRDGQPRFVHLDLLDRKAVWGY